MISLENYIDTYYICISMIVLFFSIPLAKFKKLEEYPKINNNIGVFLISTFCILFIGFRDPYAPDEYFGDTIRYTYFYEQLLSNDYGYWGLMFISKEVLNLSVSWFYFVCACIYVILPYLAFKKWFGVKAIVPLIVYVTSMSFWNFGINGIRTGLAVSFFIYALSRDRKILRFICFALAISFHKSLILPLLILLFVIFVNPKFRTTLWIWVICLLISLVFGRSLMNLITTYAAFVVSDDIKAEQYVTGLDESRFRFDFVLYSIAPIYFGRLYIKKGFNDILYLNILKIYVLTNAVWLLLMYANFTNRFAYLSWFLIPLLLVYPVVKDTRIIKSQNRFLWFVIIINLLFTLFLYMRTRI